MDRRSGQACAIFALLIASGGVIFACTSYGETTIINNPPSGPPSSTSEGGTTADGGETSFAWSADGGPDGSGPGPGPVPTTRSPGKIECGSAQCTGNQRCCIEGSMSCGSSCSTIGETRCDEPADCADGQKCCTTEKYGYISGSVCAASCANYTVCFIDDDCADGQTCVTAPAPMPGPYKTCQ